jgi:hypothetical protein
MRTEAMALPQRPRVYELSGQPPEPKLSIALAVLGTMIDEAEKRYARAIVGTATWEHRITVVDTLRQARDAVATAESATESELRAMWGDR